MTSIWIKKFTQNHNSHFWSHFLVILQIALGTLQKLPDPFFWYRVSEYGSCIGCIRLCTGFISERQISLLSMY